MWNASHRKYHTESHLWDLLEQIDAYPGLSQKNRDLLYLVAIFHDIIYEPRRNDNEERSAHLFLSNISESQHNDEIQHVAKMILDTKAHVATSALSAIFCTMDMSIVRAPFDKLRGWEEGIRYEYSHLKWDEYKERRIAFLKTMRVTYPENDVALKELIDHVSEQKEC